MTPLTTLAARRACGVFRWHGRALDAAATLGDGGPAVIVITVPQTKKRLLERLATELHFPEWFGGNWDALEECLGDLDVVRGRGLVLALDGLDRLAEHDGDAVRTLADICRDAAASWEKRGGHLLVLASGAHHLLADLDEAGH